MEKVILTIAVLVFGALYIIKRDYSDYKIRVMDRISGSSEDIEVAMLAVLMDTRLSNIRGIKIALKISHSFNMFDVGKIKINKHIPSVLESIKSEIADISLIKKPAEQIENDLKVYFVRDHIKDAFPPAFELFLVNHSKNRTYKNICVDSNSSTEGEPGGETKHSFGDLPAGSSISIDKSDVYELDMLIGYTVYLKLEQFDFDISFGLKGSPEGEHEKILGTNLKGCKVPFSLHKSG